LLYWSTDVTFELQGHPSNVSVNLTVDVLRPPVLNADMFLSKGVKTVDLHRNCPPKYCPSSAVSNHCFFLHFLCHQITVSPFQLSALQVWPSQEKLV
jgi:hypothetical protein